MSDTAIMGKHLSLLIYKNGNVVQDDLVRLKCVRLNKRISQN